MTAYIARRLLMLIPVMFGISVLVFLTVRQLPGDPALAILGPNNTSPQDVENLRKYMGLDDPLLVQYVDWMGKVLTGDMGYSYHFHGSVTGEIRSRLPVTLELVLLSMALSMAIGVPSGVLSALKQNSATDLVARVVNVVALSVPTFWLATLLLMLPAIWWGYAPQIGYVPIWESPRTNLEQFYMPAIALAAATAAAVMRMTRSSVLEVMRADYVRTARAKGLRERRVVLGHVMKNAMVPVLSIIGLQLAILLGGQVVVEEIFQLPGVGRLLITALANSDYLVVQAIVLYLAVAVVLVNLLVDVLYALLDPRIKYH
jgi:peptide/nickel transport system permease protein